MKYALLSIIILGSMAMVMRHHTRPSIPEKCANTTPCEAATCCQRKSLTYSMASLQVNQSAKDGVQFFEGSWNQLLAKAVETKKPFWVDIYTTWCGPCKQMSKFTFTDAEVGKVSNDNFLAYKIDAEKGEGVKIASQYNINAYPTILFFSAEGKLLSREEGLQDAERFVYTMGKFIKKKKKKSKK